MSDENSSVVLALFRDKKQAEDAINELAGANYDTKQISVIMREENSILQSNTGTNIGKGLSIGAVAGGVIGLVVGIATLTIPGFGLIVVAGPITAALGLTGVTAVIITSVVTGMLAGAAIGALVGLSVNQRNTDVYSQRVRHGDILLAVPTSPFDEAQAVDILNSHHARYVNSVVMSAGQEYAKNNSWRTTVEGEKL